MKVYIQFDNDKPIEALELQKGQTQATFSVGMADPKAPIQQESTEVKFTDGKKVFKIFIK